MRGSTKRKKEESTLFPVKRSRKEKMGAKAKKSLPEPILKRAHDDDFEELDQ